MAENDAFTDDERLPWLQFYPDDWRADEALRGCTLAARGLWIECLCLMHKSPQYGYLVLSGNKPYVTKLATQVAAHWREVDRLLRELKDAGVYSATSDGVIISRRMLRDEKRRSADRERQRRHRKRRSGERDVTRDTDRDSSRDVTRDTDRDVTRDESRDLRGRVRYQRPEARGQSTDPDQNSVHPHQLVPLGGEAADASLRPAPQTVLEFPTEGGGRWTLTDEQLHEWTAAYPAVDVLGEAHKALVWLRANPGRRKTARGMPKFFVSWFSRAERRQTPQPPGPPQHEPSLPSLEEELAEADQARAEEQRRAAEITPEVRAENVRILQEAKARFMNKGRP